jgi:hypothetical protein
VRSGDAKDAQQARDERLAADLQQRLGAAHARGGAASQNDGGK